MVTARRERILEMINERGSVSLKELERAFPDVSSMTLRRDLQNLDSKGLAIRVRHGARAARVFYGTGDLEPVFQMRMEENIQAKDRIATAALSFIESGRSIFLDAGTTVGRLARTLPDEDYSIITHALNVAMEISKRQRPSLIMLGGQLVKDNLSIVGTSLLTELAHFNIDTAVMSASGYTRANGFTCGNPYERSLKEAVIQKARRTILLMDAEKLGKSLPLTFARAEQIEYFIVNYEEEKQEIFEQLAQDGVQVVKA